MKIVKRILLFSILLIISSGYGDVVLQEGVNNYVGFEDAVIYNDTQKNKAYFESTSYGENKPILAVGSFTC